jgi:hypothetical protein
MKKAFLLLIIVFITTDIITQTPVASKQVTTYSKTVSTATKQGIRNSLPDEDRKPGPTVTSGSVTLSIKTVLDDYSVQEDDYTIIAKPAGLNSKKEVIKIFLPDAAEKPGKVFVIKNGSKGNPDNLYIRVEVYAPETKEQKLSQLNYYSLTAFKQVTMQSDGEQWWPIGN